MKYGKKILAVIPARGGSKGLPGKNIRPLCDKPLIGWSIELANRTDAIDKVVVSTDDAVIAEVARQFAADVPFMRPAELATDEATTRDALVHCVENLPEQFDFLVLLQPTTPLRTAHTLEACIELSIKTDRAVISASPSKKALEWMFYRKDNGIDFVLGDRAQGQRRQDCSPTYFVDGCVYCLPIHRLLNHQQILDTDVLTVLSQPQEAVDIDTLEDFEYCEYLLKRKSHNDY